MKIKIFLTFCLLFVAQSTWTPPFYTQTNASWANVILGFGPQTIAQAGCLMTSLTMMVAGEGVLFNGTMPTPVMMNEYLKLNGGFIHGDDLIWDAINPLGTVFEGFLWTTDEIIQAFQQNYRVILNVQDGHHFVLLVGIGETFFRVQDPYFNTSTYFFQDVLRAGYYLYTPFI